MNTNNSAKTVKLMDTTDGLLRCECGAEIVCSETGDMPEHCPKCGAKLDYSSIGTHAGQWVCTDNDCLQYRRPVFGEHEGTVFELAQINQYGDIFKVAHGHVYNEVDVTDDEIKQYIAMYGWSEEDIDSEEFSGLLAEAVFESSGTEYDTTEEYSSFADAALALGELIGVDVSAYI